MDALKIARVAFRNIPRAKKSIMLFGARKKTLSGWLDQASTFYANILNDNGLVTIIARFGYPPEKLREEAALVEQVEAKLAQQKKEIGEAQEATVKRDKALDKLAAYVSELKAAARVAFHDNPQQLERLGLVAKAEGTASRGQQAEAGS